MKTETKNHEPWVLGSGSPRRKELLERLGISFRVVKPDVDEMDADEYDPEALVLHNARLKMEYLKEVEQGSCILTSDTTVAMGRRIFNKPKDLADAIQMLMTLSGRTHCVFTSVVFSSGADQWEFVETSEVEFRRFSRDEAEAYSRLVNPLDKAGAYGIQDHADRIIERFTGSHSNIMGLPIERLALELSQRGYLKT